MRKKTVSLKDVAEAAGVSTALASFVLNGKQRKYRVSDAMAEKVKEIAKNLNYQPNGFAKSLRVGSSKIIGVVISDIANQFFADIARHIEKKASELGYMALFVSSDENAENMARQVEKLLGKGVDGIIAVPCDNSQNIIKSLADRQIPLVLIDRYIPGLRTDYVCLNNFLAAANATAHLIDSGYRKIAFIGYNPTMTHMMGRLEGYKQTMADKGLKDNILRCTVDPCNLEKTCEKALRNIKEKGFEAAIMATNTIATKCLHKIQKQGVKVPADLALVGFDGGGAFDFFYAPLTWIKQPLELIASKAVEILVDKLTSSNAMLQQIEIDGELIIRASSERKGAGKRKIAVASKD